MSDHEIKVKRIAALSLMSEGIALVRAGYDGENLTVVKVDSYRKLPGWRGRLAKEIKSLGEKGFHVIVEEMTDHVAQYATHVLLSDSGANGRPLLAEALDWYFGLMNSGSIQFVKGTERTRITESSIDMDMDDRGRNVYRINWRSVRGEQRSLILACLACEGMPIINDSYIEELFEAYDNNDDDQDDMPALKIARAISKSNLERVAEMDRIREQREKQIHGR